MFLHCKNNAFLWEMITKKIARGGSFEGFFTAGQLIGSSSSKVYYKKDVSKKFKGKYLCWRLFLIRCLRWLLWRLLRRRFLIKLQVYSLWLYQKVQVFSCEICEIFQNNSFVKHFQRISFNSSTGASEKR